MPTPPRMRPPTAPAAPRLNLRPTRSADSRELDARTVRPRGEREELPVPPFEPWPAFYAGLHREWAPGQHFSIVGQTGSGKTVLARHLLDIRDFVVVFGTKPRDASLYDPLVKQGYKIVSKFDAEDIDHPKIIFRPPLRDASEQALKEQREAFRTALNDVYLTGGWCIYLDELRYLTEMLRLQNELNTLYLQGRSLDVTIVAATQRPVSVPLNMFEQATHFALFRIAGREDRSTAAAYTGQQAPVVFETTALLPKYEFLYVDKTTDEAMRSRAPAR